MAAKAFGKPIDRPEEDDDIDDGEEYEDEEGEEYD